jgi:hypothetical protein
MCHGYEASAVWREFSNCRETFLMSIREAKMNFDRVRDRTAEEIRFLVENEVRKIASRDIDEGIKTFLVAPRLELRTWEWQKPLIDYPVWVVAESSRNDYGIAFSDYGFAPEHPWGLVFLSASNFDADYCWYPALEKAYEESRLIEEFKDNRRKS